MTHPSSSEREVDQFGNCIRCGGTHYGTGFLCVFNEKSPYFTTPELTDEETTPVTVPEEQRGVDKFFGTWPGNETDSELLGALDEIRKPKVEQRGNMPDGIGWCSSCDLVHEVQRPKCPKCGDWLIFAADDKPELISEQRGDTPKGCLDREMWEDIRCVEEWNILHGNDPEHPGYAIIEPAHPSAEAAWKAVAIKLLHSKPDEYHPNALGLIRKIKHLQGCANDAELPEAIMVGLQDLLTYAYRLESAAHSKPVESNGWVEIKQELPEWDGVKDEDHVRVYGPKLQLHEPFTDSWFFRQLDAMYNGEGFYVDGERLDGVTHWQPLPTPPISNTEESK